MICRRLLVLPAFFLAVGCTDDRQFTGPRVPTGPSEIISDGAHGGNKDFFFLPPMVPPPFQDPDFDHGEFNPRLQASLKIEICTLDPNSLSAEGKPLSTTPCVGPLIKTFAPGSVDLVGVPSQQSGWWSSFNLPSDGFYKVLWDTRQHDLALDKYYRIKVLLDGSDDPLGYADVDPVSNMREWRHAVTGEVVTMIDDSKLPIVFRVEKGALCGGASQCGSATITNDNPNGDSQLLQVLNEEGQAIAGVLVPDGWLPAGGPQSVVFSIRRVNTGVNDVAAGTQQFPCHANLPLQQFDGCFHFSTIPELPIIDETGRQFAIPIIGAVCFVLHDTDDPREPYVQLWSSEPDEEGDQAIPLRSADASMILTDQEGETCGDQNIIAVNSSNPLTRFAAAGWQKLTRGVGRVFGVKTAYAVDLGLGGILDGISNIGPALSARIERYSGTGVTVPAGENIKTMVRILGTQVHNGGPLSSPINDVPVTFTVTSGHGTVKPLGTPGGGSLQTTVKTISELVDAEAQIFAPGFGSVAWTAPNIPGEHTLTVTAPASGGPVTFTINVNEVWHVVESGGWNAVWTRRGSSGVFDGRWQPASGPGLTTAVMSYTRNGSSVHFQRTSSSDGNLCTYIGTVAADGASANGTETCPGIEETFTWTANIVAPYPAPPATALRMVSMQTGATIQFSATPPDVIESWLSNAPTKVQVSGTGLVTAIVGGENSNGGDGATVTTVLSTGSPGPTWLVNTPFTIFPRITTAVWVPVNGAASYDVAIEFGNGCTGYANCSLWSPEGGATGIAGSSSSFTFEFVGTQPGRWRVTARDATGAIMPGSPSPWIFFRYIDGL